MLFLNILGLCLLSIIFQAEPQLEPAWGNCEFWGRVRVSDGLIVLIQHVVRYTMQPAIVAWILSNSCCPLLTPLLVAGL